MNIAFVNAEVFTGEARLRGKAIRVQNGFFAEITDPAHLDPSVPRIDLKGKLLVPAFMDIQVYGGNGMLFSEFPSAEAVKATYDSCLSGGATHILPTISTNTMDVMLQGIEAVKMYWQQGGSRGVMGLHLEGPWLNPVKKGAHREECIKIPVMEEVRALLAAGQGVIKMITLAPECCCPQIIDLLQSEGIVLSAGHSNASYEQARQGFEKIGLATHLFNAMSPLQHRAPGMVGAIFDSPDVCASLVADGHHVDFSVIRISKKVMGERLFLITDAVTENHKGHYRHQLRGDKYELPDGTLSGSSLTMLRAVKNCIEKAGMEKEEAFRMGALYPARALGLDARLGKIKPGYIADFLVLVDQLELEEVYVGGTPQISRPAISS